MAELCGRARSGAQLPFRLEKWKRFATNAGDTHAATANKNALPDSSRQGALN